MSIPSMEMRMDFFFYVQCIIHRTPEIPLYCGFRKISVWNNNILYLLKQMYFPSVSEQIDIDVNNSCNLKMPTEKFKPQV
jgi:hypothetical protein